MKRFPVRIKLAVARLDCCNTCLECRDSKYVVN